MTAFIDLEEGALPDPEASGALDRLRRMIARLPRDQRALLAAGTLTLEGLSRLRHRRSFAALDDLRARRLLRSLAKSRLKPLRRLHYVLKMMTQFAYFSGEGAWPAIGYDGPWLGRVPVRVDPPPQVGEVEAT